MLSANGSEQSALSDAEIRDQLFAVLGNFASRSKVLAVPPDFTRFHSGAGCLTGLTHEYLGERLAAILPATGTHTPMSAAEIQAMYPGVPEHFFQRHDWRRDLVSLGEVPAEFIRQQSEGRLDYSWPVQVNRSLTDGFDLILSIGQVVPHEVI